MNSALRLIYLHKEAMEEITRNNLKLNAVDWNVSQLKSTNSTSAVGVNNISMGRVEFKEPHLIQSSAEKHQLCVIFQYFSFMLLIHNPLFPPLLHRFQTIQHVHSKQVKKIFAVLLQSQTLEVYRFTFIKGHFKIKAGNFLKTLAGNSFCVTSSSEAC